MTTLLRYQWQRLLRYKPVTRGLIAYTVMSYLLVAGLMILAEKVENPSFSIQTMFFGENSLLSTVSWLLHYLNIIPAVLIVGLIRSDCHLRMIRQQVLNGFGRFDICLGYGYFILFLSLFAITLVCLLTIKFSSLSVLFGNSSDTLSMLLKFGLHCLVIYSFSFFIGLLIQQTSLAILTLFMWYLILEPLLGVMLDYYSPYKLSSFLPFNIASELVPSPLNHVQAFQTKSSLSIWWVLSGSSLYLLLFTCIPIYYFQKKDL